MPMYHSLTSTNTNPSANVTKTYVNTPNVIKLYNMLDSEDKIKIEGVIQGLLLADKYKNQQQNLA